MDLTNGLILKTTPYLDNTKIISILTEKGKEIFTLKGATSLKSKAYQFSQELILISYAVKKNYFIGGKINKVYPKIKENIKTLNYAWQMVELLDTLSQHVKESKTLYDFTLSTLELLESGINPSLVYLIYILKNLYLFGIEPSFKHCSECGTNNNLHRFVTLSGGMLCENCYRNQNLVSFEIVDILKYLYYTKLENINFNLIENIHNINEASSVVKTFYEHFLGYVSKTEKLIKNIIN